MDYSVRSGERADLIATLRQFAVDRARGSENERSTEALRAAQQLEAGDAAYFERIIYVVGGGDRYSVVGGTRDAILAELADAAAGWDHQGEPELRVQASDAMVRVHGGADLARVGHIVYVVRA